MALAKHAVALRMFYRRDICIQMFLALNKVGAGQYKDSDSKPGVGISTQARKTATEGCRDARGVRGFFFREGFKWLLVISKGAFQALKQLIFH